ncbi:MAG: acetyl-CoA carboxylase carboxyltransferase subunit alpha [Candidatus Omnitrophica bacterium]|nr:acetyl-CoA carboxylase carboxyltransferase subunit alpha [Candidatus Omnitrophota bacterium]MDD5351692.1 acetyl-CoA carboxylase carboxyltransferase subunit alpha [Candidatus Omnitrophota bacterium]MDD5550902.1 acetyl-CoA carboxylase carboxyltransferase subunit alpha [Candidatus Omnitrophota bacterium]
MNGLDFEKPITELEEKIEELKEFQQKHSDQDRKINLSAEIKKLEDKLNTLKKEVFENLSPWQRIQIARHPRRPYTLDYIDMLSENFIQLYGDRCFADDKAIVAGLVKIGTQRLLVMGHQKGRDTQENIYRNFGCAHPEGYRKALRLMQLAEKFNLPILIFIDTPGAYPGIGAEERGQAQAIAWNLREMIKIKTPIVIYVIGEGGSGGALGIGIGDRISVLENAYYSVISPEGCAAILWKNSNKASDAAEALKLTATDLLRFGIIDEIIKEPLGGAHRDPQTTAKNIKESLKKNIEELSSLSKDELINKRYDKFRKIGVISEQVS